MKTPHINKCLKLIKAAKTDYDIKKAIAQLGSDAQWDSTVGNECTEYICVCSLEEEKAQKKAVPTKGIWL